MNNPNEIQALIQLLDDDDKEVFRHVHEKLISYGIEIIPALEQAWTSELNPAAHHRLESIIQEIHFSSLETEWEEWSNIEKPDLFTGTFLIAKYHYPDIDIEDVKRKITKLKQSIWLELNYNQTPLEQIQIFNQVFYGYHSFKGVQTTSDYQDFCINNVIDLKKGSPILIGILYQILANELNLPVYGVNLIRHYILAFCKKMIFEFHIEELLEREIMFYINPINRGSIFSRNEIKDYLVKLKADSKQKYFIPAGNTEIIKELLQYLTDIYYSQNREKRVSDFKRLGEYL